MKMFAYEPDEFSIEALSKQNISIFAECFHPDTKLPPIKFSAIIMSHLLEHFCASDAIGVLKKVKEMLLNDGILLIEVPNTPMALFGKMRLNDSPHLTFWTTISLAKAMKAAGLDVLFVSSAGEKYLDWWKRAQEIATGKRPNRVETMVKRFKCIGKSILLSSLCPRFLTSAARILSRIIHSETIYEVLSLPDFDYGQDRVYIRAVGQSRSAKYNSPTN